jgi:hypothetical protein
VFVFVCKEYNVGVWREVFEIWREVFETWREMLAFWRVAVGGRTKHGRRLAAKNLDVSIFSGPAFVYMYACMYVCVYASMYACMYVCVHVCVYACFIRIFACCS